MISVQDTNDKKYILPTTAIPMNIIALAMMRRKEMTMLDYSGDANNMVTDGGRTTEDGFGEIARKLILQINEITPLQWDRNDERERAQVEYALQAAYDKGRAAGRVEGLREAVWPNVKAPAMYENPDPGWEDPQMPDLTRIWRLAHEVGYAVGLHGSLKRDMDLIAAPWTEQAVGNAAFVDHLCAGLPAKRIGGPEHKPYGRVAVTLQMDGYFKPIDLSIAPRIDVRIAQAAQGEA